MAITAWLLAGDVPYLYLLVWLAMTGAINVKGGGADIGFPQPAQAPTNFGVEPARSR